MRRALAMIVASVWLIPAPLAAQSAGAPSVGGVVIRQNPPRPSPPPPALAAPSSPQSTDVFLAGPRTYAPRYDRQSWRSRNQRFLGGYAGYGYGYGVGYGYENPADAYFASRGRGHSSDDRADIAETGYLRLQIEPAAAEVLVDGLYMGTGRDFNAVNLGRLLEAGPHRVEIRADGFQPVTLDVRIPPNEVVTYRRDLQRLESRPSAPSAQAAPRTFYVIPGCYAGDTRPTAQRLPAGCKMASLRTVPSVIDVPARAR